MACLDIRPGDFTNDSNWVIRDGSTPTADGTTTVQLINAVPPMPPASPTTPQITVTKGTKQLFISGSASLGLGYQVFQNHILVLTIGRGLGSSQRTVWVIKEEPTRFVQVEAFSVSTDSERQANPQVHFSAVTGDVCVIAGANGADVNLSRTRISPIVNCFTGELTGTTSEGQINRPVGVRATAQEIITTFSFLDTTRTIGVPIPAFNCRISPNPQSFADVLIVAGTPPVPTQRTYTIENTGNNCMRITDIPDVAPYFLTPASRALLPATIEARGRMEIIVEFRPAAIGRFDGVRLPLVPAVPAGRGDAALVCNGTARAPRVELRVSRSSIAFGAVRVGETRSERLTIDNVGETTVDVEVIASPPIATPILPPIVWSGVSRVPLAPADPPITVTVNYTPDAEDADRALMSILSPAFSTGSRTVEITGNGCIPRPVIDPPTRPVGSFGNVRQGFRAIRLITVRNSGNGPLSFRARIEGTDAALFGIQTSGSIFTPLASETFTVNAVSTCGSTARGAGNVSFGLVFFADKAPGSAIDARLIIDNHTDLRPGVDRSFSFTITANILQDIAVDTMLVIDRSGSMQEPSGERSSKIAAALEAGQLFVRMMRHDIGDRVGLVKFNQTPELVSTITDVTAANRESLAGRIRLADFMPIGTTCIAGGVLVAAKDLREHPRAVIPPSDSYNKAIITITDGFDNAPYLNPDDGITYSLLGEGGNTPLPVPDGIKLYAIGIGNSINTMRFGQLAAATGGQFLQVREFTGQQFFALEKYLTQMYMDLVDMSTISDPVYTIRNGEAHITEFDVLKGDTDAMVVIYDTDGIRLPFHIVTPNGETIDAGGILPAGYQIRTSITATGRFVEVSMPQHEPERYAGRWKVILKHDGQACYYIPTDQFKNNAVKHTPNSEPEPKLDLGFRPFKCEKHEDPIVYGIAIGASSNFRMTPYVQPGIVKIGEPILLSAAVSEFGLAVTGATVTVEVHTPGNTVFNLQLSDDGMHQDDDANDGMYAKSFTRTDAEGAYTFIFRTQGTSREGEPVMREAVRSKFVEGREKLIPEGKVPGGTNDTCCTKALRLFIAMLVLMVILILVVWLR